MPRLPLPLRLRAPTTRLYSSFNSGPAPPKLPAAQQAEFERLRREAAVSSAFQPAAEGSAEGPAAAAKDDDDGDLNQGLYRGAKPEFKGDVNPKTGEVGGPKNEPLRWGGEGDWSYNGKVTDF